MKSKKYSILAMAFLLHHGMLLCQLQEKRILVISGGGARGAWGAGLITKLIEKQNPDYCAIFGTSTGSLMAPLIMLKDTVKLKQAYTTTTQKDIFNVNPFKKNGKIKFFPLITRVLFGKENLGETKPLRNKIEEFMPMTAYQRLRDSCPPIYVSVASLTTSKVAFKSSHKDSCKGKSIKECYDDMVDWIWASSNQPLFMTTVKKDGEEWVDGGVKENVPIYEAVQLARQLNIKVVDVIVNNIEGVKNQRWPEKGKPRIVPKLLRTIDVFSDEVRNSDILSGSLAAKLPDLKIIDELTLHIYFMKEGIDFEAFKFPHSLLFNPADLLKLWKKGQHKAEEAKPEIYYISNIKVVEYY